MFSERNPWFFFFLPFCLLCGVQFKPSNQKMPEKRYRRGCGAGCLRCWQNRLKHANPETKKYMKKYGMEHIFDKPQRHISQESRKRMQSRKVATYIAPEKLGFMSDMFEDFEFLKFR